MELKESVKFLKDLDFPCGKCPMEDACNSAGTGLCVDAINEMEYAITDQSAKLADLQTWFGEVNNFEQSQRAKLLYELTAKDAEIERLTTERDGYKGTLRSANQTNAALGKKLVEVTAERDAAVTLVEKLDRCVMLLSAAKTEIASNPALRQTIDFAERALSEWHTPAKQGEEG